MKSILNVKTCSLEIKKSVFYSYIYPSAFIKDVEHHLDHLRTRHPNANHYCYAYLLGDQQDIQKFDDDGEPQHTAGMPILNVLKKNQLTDVLCVVVREFGGIKLGAGGLVRAYTKTTSEVVKTAVFTEKKTLVLAEITADFHYSGKLEMFLRENTEIDHIEYTSFVCYHIVFETQHTDFISDKVRDLTQGQSSVVPIESFSRYQ